MTSFNEQQIGKPNWWRSLRPTSTSTAKRQQRWSALLTSFGLPHPQLFASAEEAAEDDFPLLEEGDLALLEPAERSAYEEAKAIHVQAKTALETHRKTGEQAKEAVKSARRFRECIATKKRRQSEKDTKGEPTATIPTEAASADASTSKGYDFSKSDDVARFVTEQK